jgi:two-component system NarL family response regulator
MKVLLVDDNALFLEGLRNMLEASDVAVLGTATNAFDAVAMAQRLQPELVLMDVQMPGLSGVDATRLIKAQFPKMKILMLTVSGNDEHLFDAIAAGASGYLLKSITQADLLEALAGATRGEAPLSPGLAARVLAEFARREHERAAYSLFGTPTVPLSERQKSILSLVSQGRSYKEIARDMGLSEATIKYHMGEITDRLHLENRAQAIAYALKNKTVSDFPIN